MDFSKLDSSKKIAGIVLSAGYSSRMTKGIKALLPFGRDQHMIISAIEAFKKAGVRDIFVVLGYELEKISHAILEHYGFQDGTESNIYFVLNYGFDKGMFSSIQAAFSTLCCYEEDFDAAFLLPVDASLVRSQSIKEMISLYNNCSSDDIFIPYFNNLSGHPPLIGRDHFEPIVEYTGDDGLRGYLAPFMAKSVRIDLIDEGILSDIDTDEEHEKALKFLGFTLNRELLSFKESLELMKKQELSEITIKHSIKVALGAFRLALALNNEAIKPQFALIAGLLHDIKKNEKEHPQKGEKLLNSMLYQKLACPVGTHMDLSKSILEQMGLEYSDLEKFSSLIYEEGVEDISCFYACVCVYIADRYYAGDEFVSPEKRFNRVRERFKDEPLAIAALEERIKVFNRVLAWYEKKCGKKAVDVVDAKTGHAFEEEFHQEFQQYL